MHCYLPAQQFGFKLRSWRRKRERRASSEKNHRHPLPAWYTDASRSPGHERSWIRSRAPGGPCCSATFILRVFKAASASCWPTKKAPGA